MADNYLQPGQMAPAELKNARFRGPMLLALSCRHHGR
jgi:hypothetical protein